MAANQSYKLSIDVEAAEGASRNMSGTNEKLNETLGLISKEINNMHDKWSSDAAKTTVDKFNTLKVQFDAYYERVKGFADYITNTVSQAYRDGERTITINANNIANDRAQAKS